MSTEQKKIIGDIINKHRNEMGLIQSQLAEKADLSRSYIADIEAGRYTPSVKSLISIANVLNLDLNFLLQMTEIQWWRRWACGNYKRAIKRNYKRMYTT